MGVGGEPEYNWFKDFLGNKMRYKPYKTDRAKWNFRLSTFFPGQAGSDEVQVECVGLGNMYAVHGGIGFHDSKGFNERFRLIPHGTEGWFYIWTRNEQKYIWLDKDHDYGQATLVTHKKPDGGLFRIKKGAYDCAPYFWVRPPPKGEVPRAERVDQMRAMTLEWTTTSTTPTTTSERTSTSTMARVTIPQKVTTTFLSTTTITPDEAESFALMLRLPAFVWFLSCAVHAVVM